MKKKPIIFMALLGGMVLLLWFFFGKGEKEGFAEKPLEQETRERLEKHLEVDHPNLPAEERLKEAEKRIQKPPEEWTFADIEAHYPAFKFTEEEKRLKPIGVPPELWVRGLAMHDEVMNDNGPIEFYGKVVDPEGHPLEGVLLKAKISYNEADLEKVMETKGESSRRKTLNIQTDERGQFHIKGKKGRNLVVFDFEKKGFEILRMTDYEGYYSGDGERDNWVFYFMPNRSISHQPDPNNPVEFVMKRVEQREE